MRFSNMARPDDQELVLQHTGITIRGHVLNGASCGTDTDVTLPSRHFSLVAWVGASGTQTDYVLFQKNGKDGDWFRIKIYDYSSTQRWLEIADSRGGLVNFTVQADAGYWAFVEDGGVFKLSSFIKDSNGILRETDYTPTNKLGGGPEWGSPGRVWLGCNPSAGIVMLDDLSLWDKPLAPDALMSMALRHNPNNLGTSNRAVEPVGRRQGRAGQRPRRAPRRRRGGADVALVGLRARRRGRAVQRVRQPDRSGARARPRPRRARAAIGAAPRERRRRPRRARRRAGVGAAATSRRRSCSPASAPTSSTSSTSARAASTRSGSARATFRSTTARTSAPPTASSRARTG